MTRNPYVCDYGSQLFSAVWSVYGQEGVSTDEIDPTEGNTVKQTVGFECVECGNLQLTEEIPVEHADDETLVLPDDADRDLVRE